MTREQLQEVACKPENFTKEQWEFLKAAENRISVEKEESKERAQKLKALRASELKGKVKNKQNRKSGWMKT
jgi:hypothetical protein